MTIFGRIVLPEDVEGAVTDTLKLWLPTYLSEVERQSSHTVGKTARPKSWNVTVEQDLWPAEKLPSIMVIAPGTDGDPEEYEGGKFAVWWEFAVVAVCQAPSERAVRAVAGRYAAAIRTALIQNGSLGGFAEATDWLGEKYEGAPGTQRNRSQGASIVAFRTLVYDVLSKRGGPAEPPDPSTDPVPDWAEITLVDVDVAKEPIDEG